jgi:hypothetical protein
MLDHETTGTGAANAIDAATTRQFRIAGGDFPPPLLAELTAMLSSAVPAARLQLDLKEHLSAISPVAIANFAAAVSPVAEYCVLSSDDWRAVQLLGAGISLLRRGFDPFELADARKLDSARDLAALVAEVLEIAPTADAFYLHHGFVTTALALDFNPIEQLKANGALVDVWTLDPTTPDVGRILPSCIAAGADQVTTNDPSGLARIWRKTGLHHSFGSSASTGARE